MMKCGIGIRPELFDAVFEKTPDFGFLEAHSENYFVHGVGLSLGRADHLNKQHLSQLRQLVNEVDPLFVSEHLAWSAYSHRHVPDLLPLPLTSDALDLMCEHVDQMQSYLGRQILVENPSNYLLFDQLQIPEPEFLNTLAKRTGCGLLMDINNVHVSATNVGRDSKAYIDQLDGSVIAQYHLAGYTEVEREVSGIKETVLIDTHNQTVFDPVWELYEYVLEKQGGRPTLFEWDSDFPEFDTLLAECNKANERLANANFSEVKTIPVESNTQANIKKLSDDQSGFLDKVFNLDPVLDGVSKPHQHRIWIYQNNVFAATQEYLEEVYPAVRGVVGGDFFKQMAQKFIQKTPPSEGNIHLYGQQFIEILSDFTGLKGMPYLKPLIEFEWALHTSYFATISNVLDPSQIPQEELLSMPVTFNSSVSIVESLFPVHDIYTQSLPDYDGEVSIDLNAGGDILLVYKLGHRVHHRVLSSDECAFFKEIQKTQNILQAIESVSGSISVEALPSMLGFVFEANLLKAL